MSSTALRAARIVGGDDASRTRRRQPDRALAIALGLLGLGLALNALLGPLAVDAVDYELSESLRSQAIGLEAFSLAVVVPLCLLAAVLVYQARPAGAVMAVGPAAYAAYMIVQYIVGPDYDRYAMVVLFHLGLFVLSGFVAVRAWGRIEAGHLPAMRNPVRRRHAALLLSLTAFVVLRYVPSLLGSLTEEPLPEEFAQEPAFFWTIFLMDLGLVVPLAAATAVRLRRGVPEATKAMYGLVGWFALVPPSVASMAVVMLVNDDPNASAASVAVFGVAAAAFAAYAVRLYRPLLKGRRS